MPDFTLQPELDGQAENPVFLFPPILPVGQAVGRTLTFLRATSFRLRPSIPKIALTVLPFTIAAAQPGLIHVVVDFAFYYGSHRALEWLRDAARRDNDWDQRTRDELISDSVSQWIRDHPGFLGADGSVTVVVEVPPGHLVDP